MLGLFGCKSVKKYKVDYSGSKSSYENAKDAYAAGEEVVLYYPYIATDTDYSFCLDGEDLRYDYEDDKGFVLRFTMPDHDVTLECRSHNSMIYVPPTEPEGTMLIDWYRATVATRADSWEEIVVYSYDPNFLRMVVTHSADGEETTQAEYLVPRETRDRCEEIIDAYGMRDWNGRAGNVSIDGAKLSCRFRDDGQEITVSSDNMPANGREAFSAIRTVLGSCIRDEYLLQ